MDKLIILGVGGNCIDILDTVREINEKSERPVYECIGFLDDDRETWGEDHEGVEVLGPLEKAASYRDCFFVNGIGSPNNFWKKREILSRTKIPLERFATIVHPSASVSKMSQLGHGTVVFQNATIASHVRVGHHVVVLPNSVLSHDVSVGDYSCIAGGVCVSGLVTIGQSCYLGTHSSIKEAVMIGDGCLIGMGSVVLDNVQENSVVVGHPARFLRKTQEEEK